MPLSVLRREAKPGKRWTATDAALAAALTAYESTLCPGCGNSLVESMDPDSEGDWKAPPPSRCHACTAIARRVEPYQQAEHPQALRFSAVRKQHQHEPAAASDLLHWPTH